MSTWWDRATDAQKLEQIDAGIALGMTGKQVSMNLRMPVDHNGNSKVINFANYHGRHFSRFAQRSTRRAAGLTGGIVSSRRRGIPDYTVSSAHEIFGARDSEAYELSVLDTEDAA